MSVFKVGTVVLDLENRTAGGTTLTPTEVSLIRVLAAAKGQIMERTALYREVWGFRREPQGRALDFAVMRLRKKLAGEGAPADCLPAIRGVGYRLQLDSENADKPSQQTDAEMPSPPMDAFVGREHALVKLTEAMRRPGWSTVIGPAGVGKTRLVLEAVGATAERLVVDATSFTSLAQLRARLQALLFVERPLTDAHIGTTLDRRGTRILILDGMDSLCGAVLSGLDHWLKGAPTLCVVATSRKRLEVRGEVLFRLAPLPTDASAALFRARAASMGRPVERTPALDRLVNMLDGLPLAIELAAARSRVLDIDALLRGMDDRFRLLRQGKRLSLEEAIADSWASLAPLEQEVLGRLTVVCGRFSLEFAEALLVDVDGWALEQLEVLVDQSLVQVVDGGFRLLGCIREFGRRQLSSEADICTRDAHVVALSEATLTRSMSSDLEAAAAWGRPIAAAGRCALNLLCVWRMLGNWPCAEALLSDWIDRPGLPKITRALMYREQGWHAYMMGDGSALQAAAMKVIQLGTELDHTALTEHGQVDRAVALGFLGAKDAAQEVLNEKIRTSDDRSVHARAYTVLGRMARIHDPDAAEAHWVAAEAASAAIEGDSYAAARMFRIETACQRRNGPVARALFEHYVETRGPKEHSLLWARCELCRAGIIRVEGDPSAALDVVDKVLEWAVDRGNTYSWSAAIVRRAECLLDMGAFDSALAALSRIGVHGLPHHILAAETDAIRSAIELGRRSRSMGVPALAIVQS